MNYINPERDEFEKAPKPGSGRRNTYAFPKGRLLDPEDVVRLRELVGEGELARDMLIEYLHKIQDAERCLPDGLLHALADEMRIPMAEVYEVATFYAHFDVVKDGAEKPPAVTVRVCESITCMMHGAEQLIADLEKMGIAETRIVRAPCMGRCAVAPTCEVGHAFVDHATPEAVQAKVASGHLHADVPDYKKLDAYRADGGYAVLERVRSGALTADTMIESLSDAGLRGLGGAGFPAGTKWKFVKGYEGPRLMTVNGDEGEPGTFKDRNYLERNPHQFFEGAMIAAHAVEAERIYIYMRDEYPAVLQILADEIAALEAAGLAEPGFLELRRGAGAYICGEESAMIESIEGKRGLPRHRPPYIAEVGLFDRPTLNHNVETLYWVPTILEKGADWFASQGKDGGAGDHKGFRSWSVSGRVKNPGVIIAPAGVTVAELIEKAGGMADGHSFKGYLPGGASGGILPASKADVPLDFGGPLAELGCFVGSHAVVVLSDQDDMKAIALNLMKFFEDESCGQCTPCRNGTEKAVQLMSQDTWDIEALKDLAQVMADASICGLGQAAPNPLLCVMEHFQEDLK